MREPPAALRARLLAWYDDHRRDLPWRGARDPYLVWLSEVMLQQTRVDTVRPYYTRWVERFPTVEALAAAELEEVLKVWAGLGYYARARNFHRAVREVAARHGGRVPDDPAAFRALPGVGRYTAGAVMSIAFDREEPVVDGNVRRVLARWTDDPAPEDSRLWAMAAELAAGPRPGALNQALMELGATLCTPRAPRCEACPVAEACAARAAGTQLLRPTPKKAAPLPHEDTAVPVIEREGAVLLVRRPLDARLGGMWSFPGAVRARGESVGAAAERAAREGVGVEARAGEEIGAVKHAFTHLRATYRAVRCRVEAGEPRPLRYDDVAWVAWAAVGTYPLPVAQRKVAALAAPQP